VVMRRTLTLGLLSMVIFTVLERWPRRLPARLERWVLQVVAVGVSIPAGAFALYVLSTPSGAPPFWTVPDRLEGFTNICILGVLLGPWVALGALVRQKDALARNQALELALTRSEFERHALDARLNRLQAQMTPHFLFNTLANIQALVDMNSPRATEVLRSLVAYLRAAVPRLDESGTTLGDELELARAYLELMQMRIPDRLRFTLTADPDALTVRCPPLTLITLVENAVRHGIDPSEEGGRIDVALERDSGRCRVRVSDTGVGLRESSGGLGVGLTGLRARMELFYGATADLRLHAGEPRGVVAELDVPAIEDQRT